ncbi:MAG: dihydroorotate dehydrogenase B catalytic subunit [Planctomycetes bacterium]|jgi:dihydroorotate dehydrogenase (NAD+) catalytic subunit|nr:dihydroorotate dehydrogenase B catalytic subunit [Planctomycetota bacterium]
MVELSVRLGALELRNPVMTASGTYGHGLEMCHFTPPELLGALVSKTVTLAPRPGNPTPRICETQLGLLNSIGLENKGIESYLEHTLPEVEKADTVIVTNAGGESIEEYREMARILDGQGAVDAIELNLSCPNIQGGALPFSTDPAKAAEVVAAAREATSKPLFAKLSPNVAHIARMARAVEEAGADAITAVNTLLGLSVDWRRRKPGLGTVHGGYSGPAIKPVALHCAWACARAVEIPVIGCGGISTAEDALEFLVAGCAAVQLGTACFADPALPGRLVAELHELLRREGIASVGDLIGTLRDGREENLEARSGNGEERPKGIPVR